ncbi:hypothetical protein SAMN05216236_13214 [Sedimentitalea nanhaiensis]|uniref:Uncharacterized protein n=1 Tax=Sedimentitalea nanhaiensis TaxID=999627 RepID=A0A1I7DQ65_9RHOB|nr:hypothetical protein SAMN05216236_13214 [Sedimentitalea nanhaiensis]
MGLRALTRGHYRHDQAWKPSATAQIYPLSICLGYAENLDRIYNMPHPKLF